MVHTMKTGATGGAPDSKAAHLAQRDTDVDEKELADLADLIRRARERE